MLIWTVVVIRIQNGMSVSMSSSCNYVHTLNKESGRITENLFTYAMIKWNYIHIFLRLYWNSKYISLSWYDILKHVVPIMILLLLTRKVLYPGFLVVNLMASFRKFYATMAWLSVTEYPQNRPFLIHDLSLGF
jgi:hypothetical protein